MRKGTRKSRAFGSFEGVLEGRSPVSTLVPGIAPSLAPLSPPVDVMAIGANGSIVASRPVPTPAIPLRRPFVPTTTATPKYVASATDWVTVTSTHADQGSRNVPKDEGNSIALATAYSISSPAVPPVSHAIASSATPGGVAGVAMSSPSSITPAAPTPTAPDSLAPVMINPGATDSQGAIRPLSLAPPTGGVRGIQPMYSSGGSGGSGGNPPPDKPPTILGSAGLQTVEQVSNNGVPVPGKFKIADTVPVGTIPSFNVSGSGDGYTIDSRSVIWTGGTPYSSYPLDDPNLLPPTTASVSQNVDSNSLTYSFIIDSSPRPYTIDVGVGYTNGAHGFAELTFTSDKPPYSFKNSNLGQVQANFLFDSNNNRTGVWVGMPFDTLKNVDQRMKFLGTTDLPPRSQFQGDFMILQLIDATRTVTTADGTLIGQLHTLKTNGSVIDDGTSTARVPMGQPLASGAHTWRNDHVGASDESYDWPLLAHPGVYNQSISFNADFKTYLMYRPGGGVWIALSEYDWGFRITAKNDKFPSTTEYQGDCTVTYAPNNTCRR